MRANESFSSWKKKLLQFDKMKVMTDIELSANPVEQAIFQSKHRVPKQRKYRHFWKEKESVNDGLAEWK